MAPAAGDPDERRARLGLVAAGARLAAAGLILPGEGNLSCRIGTAELVVTPRGVDKGRLAAVDLVRLTVEGEEPPPRVSTEVRLHRAVYRSDPRVGAVVHAHPPRLLALAAEGRRPVLELLEEAELVLGSVAVAAPAPSGSEVLAESVARAISDAPVCVIERHGAVAVAGDLETAVRRMLLLEKMAGLTLEAG